MVERDLNIWQDVTEYIDRRRLRSYDDELIGEVSGQFRYDRRSLLESVASRAQDEIDRYDAKAEAHDLSESVRNAVATVAVAEAGAVGLGAIVVAAASTRLPSTSPAFWRPAWLPELACSSCPGSARPPATISACARAN